VTTGADAGDDVEAMDEDNGPDVPDDGSVVRTGYRGKWWLDVMLEQHAKKRQQQPSPALPSPRQRRRPASGQRKVTPKDDLRALREALAEYVKAGRHHDNATDARKSYRQIARELGGKWTTIRKWMIEAGAR
jgi:hypothetical protein